MLDAMLPSPARLGGVLRPPGLSAGRRGVSRVDAPAPRPGCTFRTTRHHGNKATRHHGHFGSVGNTNTRNETDGSDTAVL